MNQSPSPEQNFSSLDKVKIIVGITFIAVVLLAVGILVGVLFRQNSSNQAAHGIATLPPATIVPTMFIPSTGCDSPTLVLGSTTFQIGDVRRAADGSLAVPGDTSGIAYRVEGTGNKPVFILSPTPQNVTAMASISVGSPARVTWADCSSVTYRLAAAQAGVLDSSIFASQPEDEITVFFPTASSAAGFVFKGRRITEPLATANQPTPVIENTLPPTVASTSPPVVENTSTPLPAVPTGQSIASPTAENITPTSQATVPPPDYGEVLAEIGLVDTGLSLFRISLKIEVSIYNFGIIPITLSERDVSLTQPDGTPLALKSSNPSLPIEIQSGETKTIEINFETPSSPTAILRILTVEYDIEGY